MSKTNGHNGNFGAQELGKLLSEMNTEADFPIAVVTNRDGLVIASSSPGGMDPQRQSAVAAKVGETAALASAQLQMGRTDEISISADQGQHLVCRPIPVNGKDLFLAVMLKDRAQPYRRATNKVIAHIRQHWAL